MITVLRPVPGGPDPTSRSPAVYRQGLSVARRELQAGTARRHRVAAVATTVARPAVDIDAMADGPATSDPRGGTDGPSGCADLAAQRAGVRAALAELRRHRGPA